MALVNIVNLVCTNFNCQLTYGRQIVLLNLEVRNEKLFSLTKSTFSFLQTVLDNPTCFLNPFQFEITFECLQELDDGKYSDVAAAFLLYCRLVR
jgi:ASF1 like histone chaperone